jgi:hypothetical protein
MVITLNRKELIDAGAGRAPAASPCFDQKHLDDRVRLTFKRYAAPKNVNTTRKAFVAKNFPAIFGRPSGMAETLLDAEGGASKILAATVRPASCCSLSTYT